MESTSPGAMGAFVQNYGRRLHYACCRYRNLQRSQLSRMVSGLEEELGVQLLERRGKRLNPTQVALELRSKIEPHIVMVRRALEKTSELEEGDKGSIRFGAMPGFLQTQVVPLIAEFQQLHPQVTSMSSGTTIQRRSWAENAI